MTINKEAKNNSYKGRKVVKGITITILVSGIIATAIFSAPIIEFFKKTFGKAEEIINSGSTITQEEIDAAESLYMDTIEEEKSMSPSELEALYDSRIDAFLNREFDNISEIKVLSKAKWLTSTRVSAIIKDEGYNTNEAAYFLDQLNQNKIFSTEQIHTVVNGIECEDEEKVNIINSLTNLDINKIHMINELDIALETKKELLLEYIQNSETISLPKEETQLELTLEEEKDIENAKKLLTKYEDVTDLLSLNLSNSGNIKVIGNMKNIDDAKAADFAISQAYSAEDVLEFSNELGHTPEERVNFLKSIIKDETTLLALIEKNLLSEKEAANIIYNSTELSLEEQAIALFAIVKAIESQVIEAVTITTQDILDEHDLELIEAIIDEDLAELISNETIIDNQDSIIEEQDKTIDELNLSMSFDTAEEKEEFVVLAKKGFNWLNGNIPTNLGKIDNFNNGLYNIANLPVYIKDINSLTLLLSSEDKKVFEDMKFGTNLEENLNTIYNSELTPLAKLMLILNENIYFGENSNVEFPAMEDFEEFLNNNIHDAANAYNEYLEKLQREITSAYMETEPTEKEDTISEEQIESEVSEFMDNNTFEYEGDAKDVRVYTHDFVEIVHATGDGDINSALNMFDCYDLGLFDKEQMCSLFESEKDINYINDSFELVDLINTAQDEEEKQLAKNALFQKLFDALLNKKTGASALAVYTANYIAVASGAMESAYIIDIGTDGLPVAHIYSTKGYAFVEGSEPVYIIPFEGLVVAGTSEEISWSENGTVNEVLNGLAGQIGCGTKTDVKADTKGPLILST